MWQNISICSLNVTEEQIIWGLWLCWYLLKTYNNVLLSSKQNYRENKAGYWWKMDWRWISDGRIALKISLCWLCGECLNRIKTVTWNLDFTVTFMWMQCLCCHFEKHLQTRYLNEINALTMLRRDVKKNVSKYDDEKKRVWQPPTKEF